MKTGIKIAIIIPIVIVAILGIVALIVNQNNIANQQEQDRLNAEAVTKKVELCQNWSNQIEQKRMDMAHQLYTPSEQTDAFNNWINQFVLS